MFLEGFFLTDNYGNVHPNSTKIYKLLWVKYFLVNVGNCIVMDTHADILTGTLSKNNNK